MTDRFYCEKFVGPYVVYYEVKDRRAGSSSLIATVYDSGLGELIVETLNNNPRTFNHR